MPLRQAPVEWPTALAPLLQEAQIASGRDGKRVCHIDVDVDARTLLAIHEFEAHLRHRPVQLKLAESAECVTGEMNPSFGLGPHPTGAATLRRCASAFTTFRRVSGLRGQMATEVANFR
jgi:hypothetical protein